MEPERGRKIKGIVRANFDLSPDAYERFESRHGLFARLTRALARLAGVGVGHRVLDMGCGTGDSTLVLGEFVGPGGFVLGVDLSRSMLRRASPRSCHHRNVSWLQADAEDPSCMRGRHWNAVLYNASAFLLPDPRAAFERASTILLPSGIVGQSILMGLVEGETVRDALADLRDDASLGLGRGSVVDPAGLAPMLESTVGPITARRLIVPMAHDGARDFYAIPAQSASLFPRRPLPERLDRVGVLFDRLDASGQPLSLWWELVVARLPGDR